MMAIVYEKNYRRPGIKAMGHAECEVEGCGARSKTYTAQHLAANLSLCEQAEEQEGWDFSLDFVSMLVGSRTWCPAHKRKESK